MHKLILLILFISACGQNNVPAVDTNKTLTFVLAGQSNLAGNSQLNTGLLPSSNTIFTHRNPDWSFTSFASYSYPTSGPGTNIARALESRYPGYSIKIINVAAGGSSMWDWRTNGVLYPSMLSQIKLSIQNGDIIKGFLWYQGESETGLLPPPSLQQPTKWAALFQSMLSQMRVDLGVSLPIVFAQIATTTNPTQYPNYGVVKAQQQLFHDETGIPMIKTEDLKLYDDVHIDASQFDTEATRWVAALDQVSN